MQWHYEMKYEEIRTEARADGLLHTPSKAPVWHRWTSKKSKKVQRKQLMNSCLAMLLTQRDHQHS